MTRKPKGKSEPWQLEQPCQVAELDLGLGWAECTKGAHRLARLGDTHNCPSLAVWKWWQFELGPAPKSTYNWPRNTHKRQSKTKINTFKSPLGRPRKDKLNTSQDTKQSNNRDCWGTKRSSYPQRSTKRTRNVCYTGVSLQRRK